MDVPGHSGPGRLSKIHPQVDSLWLVDLAHNAPHPLRQIHHYVGHFKRQCFTLIQMEKLPQEAAHEMMDLAQRMERVLRQVYKPEGINLGMNLGKAAGAGVAGHVHLHALPRWVADANFMTVVGETRVLPETLETTYGRIKAAMAE